MIWKALLILLACSPIIGEAALVGEDHWVEIETLLSRKAPLLTQKDVDEGLNSLMSLKCDWKHPIRWCYGSPLVGDNVERLAFLKSQFEKKDCSDLGQDARWELFEEVQNYPNVRSFIKHYLGRISLICQDSLVEKFDKYAQDLDEGQIALIDIWFFVFRVIFLELADEDEKDEHAYRSDIHIIDYVGWAGKKHVGKKIFDKFIQESYDMSTDLAAQATFEAVKLLARKEPFVNEENKFLQYRLIKPSVNAIVSVERVDNLYWKLVSQCKKYRKIYGNLFDRVEREAELVGHRSFFSGGFKFMVSAYYLGYAAYRLCDNLVNVGGKSQALNEKVMKLAVAKPQKAEILRLSNTL